MAKKNIAIFILFFFFSVASFGGDKDSVLLSQSVTKLSKALIAKDSATLKKLLHKKVTYGHSNGWIEGKREIIEDLYSGKLVYKSISNGPLTITEEENIASVRNDIEVEVVVEGHELKMKLHVLQVWMKEKKGWLLISRQSTKI
jgi:hypothetical protein